jgi:C4-dicarboxylate transporter, DctM subunit
MSTERPRSWLRGADDAVFRAEKAMISVFLIAMTAMVFIDVVYRRLSAPDSRIGRLIASFTGVASNTPERAFLDANIAPIVGAVVGVLLLWAGYATAQRNGARLLLGSRFSAILLALVTAAFAALFGLLLLSFESWVVYLILYGISIGLYLFHLVRTRPDGWKLRALAVLFVLTPAFLVLALRFFPQEYNWAKELAMLMVLWVGFFGASICVHEGKHIRIEALEKTWPVRARAAIRIGSAAVAAVLCAFLVYLGYRYVVASVELEMRLIETDLPDWVMTVSIPIAFALTCIRLLGAGISAARGGDYGAPAKPEGMEEAEKIARERGDGIPEPHDAPLTSKRGSPIFYAVIAAAIAAPILFGKAGILIAVILVAALLTEPVFVIIGLVTIACFMMWTDEIARPQDFSILIERMRGLADNKALLSVPFYVMSGAVMGFGQIGRRLVDFSNAWLGWLPGGLAISVIAGCMLFSAISGSSPATVIAIGSVMGPALIKHGYKKDFSLGLVTAAGSLGILIPPSIPMIVYCIVNRTTFISVEEFHAAGFAPGFVIGGVLAVYCIYRGLRDGTPRESFSATRAWEATRDGLWSLLFPVLILGGIYLGFFDDIEAACTSVVYALVIEIFVHRAFKMGDVPKIFMEVGVLLGSFLVVLVLAISFGEFLEIAKIPEAAARFVRSLDLEPWQFLLVLNLLLLVVGCFMDIMSAMFLFVPLLAPLANELGIDPIHFGMIFIVNLEIGYLLPPMGLNLFVSATLFGQPITFIMKAVVPFIFVMIVGLMIITYVPSITLESARWVMALARSEPPPPPPPPEVTVEPGQDGGVPAAPRDAGPVLTMEEMMELMMQQGEPDAGVPAP